MKARRTATIRSRLALLVMACLIPASLMAVALIAYNYQTERSRLVRDSIATARAMVQAIDRELTSITVAAEVLSTSPHLESGDTAAFYAQAQSVVRRQIGNNVVLSDTTGLQVMNTVREFGERLPSHGNPGQLRKVFDTGRPVVSDIYVGGVLQIPLMSVDVPVFRDGKAVYDLSIGIFPDRFVRLLSDQRLPSGWIAAVFDSTGTIVARTHEMERFVGKKGAPALVKRMTEISEGFLETTTVEGIPVLSVFSRSGVSNWTVAIGIPTRILTTELRQVLWWLIFSVVILLLSSLGFASAIGGRITRSIHGLTEPALALGFGQPVKVSPLDLKEADEVGHALMKASKMLREAEHRAHHDVLTGLANRALFDEIVEQQLATCHRSGTVLSVLYVDLDGFKEVNDIHGHATGDELLRAVAARLKKEIRRSDVVARLGGDEFAIVLVHTAVEGAKKMASNLADKISMPYLIGPLKLKISASIGVAGYPDSGTTSEELLQSADEAMYQEKAAKKRRTAPSRGPRGKMREQVISTANDADNPVDHEK
jgi:diguanylate cyclase (GGDEF)-like protein